LHGYRFIKDFLNIPLTGTHFILSLMLQSKSWHRFNYYIR